MDLRPCILSFSLTSSALFGNSDFGNQSTSYEKNVDNDQGIETTFRSLVIQADSTRSEFVMPELHETKTLGSSQALFQENGHIPQSSENKEVESKGFVSQFNEKEESQRLPREGNIHSASEPILFQENDSRFCNITDVVSQQGNENKTINSQSLLTYENFPGMSESPSRKAYDDSPFYDLAEENPILSYSTNSKGDSACEGLDACQGRDVYCDNGCNNWDIWIYPDYFYVGHTEGKGIGYRKGFTTLGFFLAPSFLETLPCVKTFLDAKGYLFNRGKWAASTGVGTRFILSSRNIVLGLNVYYDYRKMRQFNLNQIGVGLEVLGPSWDFRLNGYIAAGKTSFRENRLFDFSGDFFAIRQRRVSAWSGIDGEIGTWIKRKYTCDWWGLYVAAGPYYYSREHKRDFNEGGKGEVFGGRVRLLARIFDILDLSIIATYDPKWHTGVQGQITLAIPLDGGWLLHQKSQCECQPSPCLLEQIAQQPIQRNGIIVADQFCSWLWTWSNESSDNSYGRPTSHFISSSAFESFWDSSSEYSASFF